MAMCENVEFRNREECLLEFARTLGRFPPRSPVPSWWDEFEKWYLEARGRGELRLDEDPGVTCALVRMEPYGHEDDEDDREDRWEDYAGTYEDYEDNNIGEDKVIT